jgi:hypothetical protein
MYGSFVPYQGRTRPQDQYSRSTLYKNIPVAFSGAEPEAYSDYKPRIIRKLMDWAREQALMGNRLYNGPEDINIGSVGVLSDGLKQGIAKGIRSNRITAAWNEIFDFSSICAELRVLGRLSDSIAMYHLKSQENLQLEALAISAMDPCASEYMKITSCEHCFNGLVTSPRASSETLIIHAEKTEENTLNIVAQPLGFIFPTMDTWQPSFTENSIHSNFPVTYSSLAKNEVQSLNDFLKPMSTNTSQEARKLLQAAQEAYQLCVDKNLCAPTNLEAGAAGLFWNGETLQTFAAPANDKGRRDRLTPEIFVHQQAMSQLQGLPETKIPLMYAYFSRKGLFPSPIQIKRLYKDAGCDMSLLIALIQDSGIHVTTLADHQRVVYTKRSHLQEKRRPWKQV